MAKHPLTRTKYSFQRNWILQTDDAERSQRIERSKLQFMQIKEREMIALENKIKKIKDNQTEKIE